MCDVASDDLLTLIADCVPRNKLGYFLMGSGQNTFTPPGSAGHFCIGGGQIIRLLPSASNSMDLGTFSHSIGTTSLPIVGQISAGQTWNFQAWFRDRGSSSNMTDAISVTFQ